MTSLQPFYMCEENGRSTAFLCPNGTIFNQQYFVCDWWIDLNYIFGESTVCITRWYNIDCAAQPDFFSLNQFIYDGPEEGEPVHILPKSRSPIWRPAMHFSLLYRWLAEAGSLLLGNKRSTALGTLLKAAGHSVPTTNTSSSLDIAQWRPFPKCSHCMCCTLHTSLTVATEKLPRIKKCTISMQQVMALSRTSHLRFQAVP